ncbi:MAG: hypothetical protein AB7G93_15500 [Bdellovibrionales bacterium]
MSPVSTTRRWLVALVTVVVAFPPHASAGPHPSSGGTAEEAMDRVPVALMEINIGGADVGYLVMAPVPRSRESETVFQLSRRADQLALGISGNHDLAFLAAKASGQLTRIRTFVMDSLKNAPLFMASRWPASLKTKLADKIQAITTASPEKQSGLIFAFIYGNAVGTSTFYVSSSVEAGLQVFAAYTLWASFAIGKNELWGRIMQRSGRAFQNGADRFAAWLYGRELTDQEKRAGHVYAVAGEVLVSQVISTGLAAWALYHQGILDHGVMEYLVETAWIGTITNLSIWDAWAKTKERLGQFSHQFVERIYFPFVFTMGTAAEAILLATMQTPDISFYVSSFLSVTVLSGFLARLMDGSNLEASVVRHVRRSGIALSAGVDRARQAPQAVRRSFSSVRSVAKSCALALSVPRLFKRGRVNRDRAQ